MWQSKLIHQFQKQFSNVHHNIDHHLIDSIYENTIHRIRKEKFKLQIFFDKMSFPNSVLLSLLYDVF